MKIIIHRGSHEIGGTCIQLSTAKTTILLDLGLPLSSQSKELDVGTLKPDAVIISHSHQDHYGLIDQLHTDVPVYIGELAKGLIDATRIFLGNALHPNAFRHFNSWQPFTIGDFTITPYLMDHSAVDAYGFLIEADGKRIYYSGDFRATGRKHKLFDNIVKIPPKDIDLLFMEGTMLQRNSDAFPKEAAVEMKIFETLQRQGNISFVISSSQNIDRIVSAYRACKKAGKLLVIDIYTAWILEQVRRTSTKVPGMEWDEVRIYADYGFDKKLKEQPEYFGDFRRRLYKHRVRWQELIASPSCYLYFGRMSSFRKIRAFRGEEPVNVIYSQWEGYLKGTNKDYYGAEQMAAMRHDPQVNFVYAHTSGHATVEDLKRFANALQAKRLVPVHTEYGDLYRNLFGDSVVVLQDGEIMEI
jgi:ribonuclease J